MWGVRAEYCAEVYAGAPTLRESVLEADSTRFAYNIAQKGATCQGGAVMAFTSTLQLVRGEKKKAKKAMKLH